MLDLVTRYNFYHGRIVIYRPYTLRNLKCFTITYKLNTYLHTMIFP